MPRLVPVLLALALTSLSAAAQESQCPTATPPSGVDPTSLTDRARILEYAHSLTFHPAQAPTGESRMLTEISTPGSVAQRRFRLGPQAAVRPESCAYLNNPADLAAGAGRIVGMTTLSAAYPKLHLPRGEAYIWIDNLDGTAVRAVVIPNDLRTPAETAPAVSELHPGLPNRSYSAARWIFDPDDDTLWFACERQGCCIIGPGGS